MKHPDQKYIDALLHGNDSLLREIYMKYSGTIKNLVLQHGGNETDAADIFQEALLSIYNKAKNGGFVLTCPFEGFLYLVCKRKWKRELEKRNRKVVTTGTGVGYNISDTSMELAEECMLHEERKDLILQNIVKLGDGCKQLLYLSWGDNTMEEVAAILKLSYGYARKKKSECMAKLINLIRQSPKYNSLKW